jgi:hypothetical protein
VRRAVLAFCAAAYAGCGASVLISIREGEPWWLWTLNGTSLLVLSAVLFLIPKEDS